MAWPEEVNILKKKRRVEELDWCWLADFSANFLHHAEHFLEGSEPMCSLVTIEHKGRHTFALLRADKRLETLLCYRHCLVVSRLADSWASGGGTPWNTSCRTFYLSSWPAWSCLKRSQAIGCGDQVPCCKQCKQRLLNIARSQEEDGYSIHVLGFHKSVCPSGGGHHTIRFRCVGFMYLTVLWW